MDSIRTVPTLGSASSGRERRAPMMEARCDTLTGISRIVDAVKDNRRVVEVTRRLVVACDATSISIRLVGLMKLLISPEFPMMRAAGQYSEYSGITRLPLPLFDSRPLLPVVDTVLRIPSTASWLTVGSVRRHLPLAIYLSHTLSAIVHLPRLHIMQ